MYQEGRDRLVVSASDLVGFLVCDHLTTLSQEAAQGKRQFPTRDDPEVDLLRRRGLDHERSWLRHLEKTGVSIERIATGDAEEGPSRLAEQVEQTFAALRSGAEVIYQGAFLDRGDPIAWRGHADFLHRVERPSDLGDYSYEPADTKLARRVRPSTLLQLCNYADHLTRVQGVAPEEVRVVLGGQDEHRFRLASFAAYYRAAKERFEAALLSERELTYPDPVEHCTVCRWLAVCDAKRTDDDHLCLVAGLGREQSRKIAAAGLSTVQELADAKQQDRPPRMAEATFERFRRQARLQVAAREQDELPYEILDPGTALGLATLPTPSPGDVFFDIEGDPFIGSEGLEYLFGVGWIDEAGEFQYRSFWAHDTVEEKGRFEELLDWMGGRIEQDPGSHIYHYAHYERTALGRLMGRHATREEETDRLFRGQRLVDLYQIVRHGVAVGSSSYSLKDLEPLYMEAREAEVADAVSSIVAYEEWLETGAEAILHELEDYNRADCFSTWKLREWLEERRTELETEHGPIARPSLQEPEPSENLAEVQAETTELAAALLEDVPQPREDRSPGQQARWLLAQLLDYHRREEKPEWWKYFYRINQCNEEDLYLDTEALAGLELVGEVDRIKQSTVWRYRFDPGQEHKIRDGLGVVDPDAQRAFQDDERSAPTPGTVVAVDPTGGTIDLKRGNRSQASHPRNLIPGGPVRTAPLRQALQRLGSVVVAHGIEEAGPKAAARDLLLRAAPRLRTSSDGPLREPGEETVAAARRLALDLDSSYLPIQGPPGSGKTYTAARMIVHLVANGQVVGITAPSHAVIGNLLEEVMGAADEEGVALRALQKATPDQRCSDARVRATNKNQDIAEAIAGNRADVVAGTAWLFSREELDGTIDTLVVDEAGQLSLANTLAAAGAARNLILVGDPQQLSQPSQGTHPEGAEAAALEHVLAGHNTVPEDRGLFLDRSWRLHPEICQFISELAYDERLESMAHCANHSIGGDGELSGHGLRWVPVTHEGNRTSSEDEAEVLAALYDELLGHPWTDGERIEGLVGPEEILVVAPYNAQVALLAHHLPEGARVGTVDRFQGQQAPVVLVSLTASSAQDVPHGMEFLYSQNRLNVSISRAQALAVVVGSPKLLSVRCRTIEQMRLVNGVCRFVEQARELCGSFQ